MTLEWDNPFNGVTGKATADLDLFVYNTKHLVASINLDDNIGSGIPVESLELDPGSYKMQIQVAALSPGTAPPDMFKINATPFGNGGIGNLNYAGIMSSGYGHATGQNTISVGAVPFSSYRRRFHPSSRSNPNRSPHRAGDLQVRFHR